MAAMRTSRRSDRGTGRPRPVGTARGARPARSDRGAARRSIVGGARASILVLVLVAACGGPTPPAGTPAPPAGTAAPATAAPTSAVPTEVPTTSATSPPFACGETVRRPASVPVARMSGLAATNDAGIGRITFTFLAAGSVAATPEVEVRPGIPPFTMDPSGLPLEVGGTAFVVIILRGGTALDADYRPTFAGPFDIAPGGSPIVELRRGGDFEAVSTFVVGLAGEPCVRLLPPDGRSRLVIEVATRSTGSTGGAAGAAARCRPSVPALASPAPAAVVERRVRGDLADGPALLDEGGARVESTPGQSGHVERPRSQRRPDHPRSPRHVAC